MDQYGKLIITIQCIKVMGMSRSIVTMPQQLNVISCYRSEAQTIVNEHARQAARAAYTLDYTYDWQPCREQMIPE